VTWNRSPISHADRGQFLPAAQISRTPTNDFQFFRSGNASADLRLQVLDRAQLPTWRKLEIDLKVVVAGPAELVFHDHHLLLVGEPDGPGVYDPNTFVPSVRCSQEELSVFVPLLDLANFSLAPNPKQASPIAINRVLLLAINYNSIVGSGSAK
jgi:hypothetical protein